MSLKTSFFNKSLYKSDIKRFWWIGVLETLVLFMSFVMPLFEETENWYRYRLYWGGSLLFICAVAVGIVALLFSYMHFSASVSTLHSFPVKKKCLYITKLVSGFTLMVLPIIINMLLIGVVQKLGPADESIILSDVLGWALIGIIYIYIVFSLAVFTNSMTGNPVGTLVFTVGFIVLPMVISEAVESICQGEMLGYSGGIARDVQNLVYIEDRDILKPDNFAIYIILGTVMLLVGYFLYKYRKLENHGEVITFSWLKPIFIGIISVLSSSLGYDYLCSIFDNYNLLYMLPIGVLGTVIAWMVAKKSISPKGILKPVCIYALLAGVVIAIIGLDVTGFEKRVPKIEDVYNVKISDNVGYYFSNNISLSSEEDVANIIKLHKHFVKEKDITGDRFVNIEYLLKNGKTLRREYLLDLEDVFELLKPILESEDYKKGKFPVLGTDNKEYIEMYIRDNMTIYPGDEFTRLLEAIRLDLDSAKFEDIAYGEEAFRIELTHKIQNEKTISSGTHYPTSEAYSSIETYIIRKSYVNTINVLKELGIYVEKNIDKY